MPTDRLHAEWWMNSPRVQGALSGNLPLTEVKETIRIPAEIGKWKKSSDLTQALAVQSKVREQFQSAFASGMAAIGFEQDVDGNGIFQLGIAEVDVPRNGPDLIKVRSESMKIESIILREIRVPLVKPFETSFGSTTDRRILLAEIRADGLTRMGRMYRRRASLLQRRDG